MVPGSLSLGNQQENQYAVIAEPPYPPSWRALPHHHALHELGLVKSGKCTILLSSREESFEANEVFFFPSGVAHGFQADSDTGVQFVVVQFAFLPVDLLQILTNASPIGHFKLFPLETSVFLDLAHRIQQECAGNLPWSELQCQALLQELTVLLLRSHERGIFPYLNPEQKETIEQALYLLRERAYERVKITQIARELGLSPQHFRDLFRRYVGVSPKTYLTALRLQRSKCMLLHAEYRITDIALQLGFANVQQFSKTFRRNTGMNPAEWRRIHFLQERNAQKPRKPLSSSPGFLD
ncbi:MAG: AraC family transcriptional regulator, partial [Atribacterota bacterium]|nr:AraC family transcriptional regulator [Atribacterota bacterium]